jgi:hypothetical protein
MMIKIAIAIVFTALLAAYCIHVLFPAADID